MFVEVTHTLRSVRDAKVASQADHELVDRLIESVEAPNGPGPVG
jgi:hypothetical protein